MNLTMNKYFRPGVTTLERLERERERVQGCRDRNVAHYDDILKDLDEEIAAMKKQQEARNGS